MQGATFWDWTEDGLQQDTTVPVLLDLNPDTFAASAAEKGVGTERPVVLYDEGTSGSMFACRRAPGGGEQCVINSVFVIDIP